MSTSWKKETVSTLLAVATGLAASATLTACAEYDDNIVSTSDRPTFEEFEAATYKEPWEGGVYIVNGDTPLENEKRLLEFYNQVFVEEQLIVNQVNGVDDVWNSTQKRNISYCVSDTFGSNKSRVVAALADATGQWEAAADIQFVHVTAEDGDCTARNNAVEFDVRPVRNQSYLARAFFPSSTRRSSNVLIDGSAFSTSWSLENILAHELGHVLGFRHEHTRPESGTCFENSAWRPLTPYDSSSIMHYPQCNGSSSDLSMTARDRQGAAALYGAPGSNPPPPPVGTPRTATSEGSLARREEANFDAIQVLPGTLLSAEITGTGDVDLYVRFGSSPTLGSYDCRPYLNGSSERCALDVPAGETEAFIMLRGYSSGTYQLEVNWTEP